MPWYAWLAGALAALYLIDKGARWLTFWAWVRSVKGPKERMEAEILWRSWRRSGRRKLHG